MTRQRNVRSCAECLEARRLLSATTETLAIGSVLYTATQSGIYNGGSDLFRSNLDGSSRQSLAHWQSGLDGPTHLFAVGSKLIFAADDSNNYISGAEPWSSDGTVVGTTKIADLNHGSVGSNPRDFALVGGRAVFLANTGGPDNIQLYSTDGTAIGTKMITPFFSGVAHERFTSAVRNVEVNPTAVTWDQHNDYDGQLEHLSSDGLTYQILYAVPTNGIATIGTADYDSHTIRLASADGYLNVTDDESGDDGSTTRAYRFRNADVTGIAIIGSNAADSVMVDASIAQPTTIQGGFGNDMIVDSGNGADSIDGGVGADTITASASHDTIVADSTDSVIDNDPTVPSGDGGGTDTTGGGGSSDGGGQTSAGDDGGSTGTDVGPTAQTPEYTLRRGLMADGVLRVYGTDGNDTIKLIRSATSIKLMLNGVMSKVLRSAVRSIVIDAAGGDDVVTVSDLAIPSKMYGGSGDDSLTGSAGKDRIYGGDGDDVISGGDNHDTIYGEAGDDRLFGGNSRDYLVGGAGTNVIRGEGSIDRILHGEQDDVRSNDGDKMSVDSIVG